MTTPNLELAQVKYDKRLKEVFDMIYKWGQVGIQTDADAPAFRDAMDDAHHAWRKLVHAEAMSDQLYQVYNAGLDGEELS